MLEEYKYNNYLRKKLTNKTKERSPTKYKAFHLFIGQYLILGMLLQRQEGDLA